MPSAIDISAHLLMVQGLPRVDWGTAAPLLNEIHDERERWAAWTAATHHWLDVLADKLEGVYYVEESEHFQLLSYESPIALDCLLTHAERCLKILTAVLPGIAQLRSPGKLPIIVLPGEALYCDYVAAHTPESEIGKSSGMQIRGDCPHIAVCGGGRIEELQTTIAHEVMHAALCGLSSPLWIEEGMAQVFDERFRGYRHVPMTHEALRLHHRYWRRFGLETFWSGEGFSRAGKVQTLHYQLADVLMRLLLADYRIRWFGWDKHKFNRLMAFFKDANEADHGRKAARDHLHLELEDLAAKFLGKDVVRAAGRASKALDATDLNSQPGPVASSQS